MPEQEQRVAEIRKNLDRSLVIQGRVVPGYVVHDTTPAAMLALRSNMEYYAAARETQDQVRAAVAETVPQVQNGEIEIAAIARIKGVGWKIAVRWAAGGDSASALVVCLGEEQRHVRKLRESFLDEFVAIIPWCEDAENYITSALYPLSKDAVRSIRLDTENLVAEVEVDSREALAIGLGRRKANLTLASTLTGWSIMLTTSTGAGSSRLKSPDDEFKDVLTSEVTEIRNGQIEIVRVARIPGVGSRALVRWKDGRSGRASASSVCQGTSQCHLNAIRQALNNEWVYIHDWTDRTQYLIIAVLYPLRRDDVVSVKFDESSNTAFVTVSSVQRSPMMWRSVHNLVLAERVLGLRIEISETDMDV